MTTPTKENARASGGSGRAQSSRVSGLHTESIAHAAVWGVSSGGLIFPSPDSCKGQLLAELLARRGASHRTFDGRAHSMWVAVYIKRLRDDGWPIVTELVAGSNRFERVLFTEYRLADGVTIGEAERVFVAACELAALRVL